MVPKESGFNLSEMACGLCVRIVWRFLCSPAKGWWNYTKAAFLSLRRHNLPSTVSLCNNQTARNVYCRCNNDAIFSDRAMFTFPTAPVCQPRSGRGKALAFHAKLARWRQCWIHYLSCLKLRFYRGIMITLYINIIYWFNNVCIVLDLYMLSDNVVC